MLVHENKDNAHHCQGQPPISIKLNDNLQTLSKATLEEWSQGSSVKAASSESSAIGETTKYFA